MMEKIDAFQLDIEEGAETLLSTKMKKLTDIQPKCLSQLTICSSNSKTLSDVFSKQFSINSLTSQKTSQWEIKLSKFRQLKSTKKKKVSNFKNSSGREDKRDIKLFQVAGEGRKKVLTEVKDAPLDQFTGKGILKLPNGKTFEGEWIEGVLINKVKISYQNGNIYVGEVYQYRAHGKGQLTYKDGRKYVGEFSGSDFHGDGTLYDADGGILYEGLWRRGVQYDK